MAAAEPASGPDGATAAPRATVVVSHLDVTYRVTGAGRPAGDRSALDRLLRRGDPAPGRVKTVEAVKDVSFVAHHGESIGIIGRNGSGKSTLLRAVAGLIPPSGGQVWVAGEPALLGVNAVLMGKLTGERNIYLGCQALGLTKAEIKERFDEIVDFSGIGDAVYMPMSTYSSGMGARLRFAISTAAQPDVLMVDEALATGDADFRARSGERIAQMRENAATVFLVSHSNSTVREICDRALWMEAGELLMDGPAEEVLAAYEATLPKRRKKSAPPEDPTVPGVERWAGRNRWETAAELSRRTHGPGVDTVLLATGADAGTLLTLVPPATRHRWPVLLVQAGVVPEVTRTELARLAPRRVVLVGPAMPEVTAQLVELGIDEVETWEVEDATQASLRAAEEMVDDTPHPPYVLRDSQRRLAVPLVLEAARSGSPLLVLDPDLDDDGVVELLGECVPSGVEAMVAPETMSPELRQRLVGRAVKLDWEPLEKAFVTRSTAADDEGPVETAYVVATTGAVETVLGAAVAALDAGAPFLGVTKDDVPDATVEALRRLRPGRIVVLGDSPSPGVLKALGELVP